MVAKKTSAPLSNAQRKKGNDRFTLVIVALAFMGTFLTILVMGMRDRAFAPKPTQLTLTAAGCEYLQAQAAIVGKPVGKNGGCEADVDYVSYRLGSGGHVYFGFEDTKSLEISGGQVVGVIRLPDQPDRKWTYEQKKTTWLLAASLAFMLALPFWMLIVTRKSK